MITNITNLWRNIQNPVKNLRWRILQKRPILDFWQGSECVSDYTTNNYYGLSLILNLKTVSLNPIWHELFWAPKPLAGEGGGIFATVPPTHILTFVLEQQWYSNLICSFNSRFRPRPLDLWRHLSLYIVVFCLFSSW